MEKELNGAHSNDRGENKCVRFAVVVVVVVGGGGGGGGGGDGRQDTEKCPLLLSV